MNIVPKDFVFNTDKTHARLSKRGTAKLLKVSHTAINNLVSGGNLIKAAKYFIASEKTKVETKLH